MLICTDSFKYVAKVTHPVASADTKLEIGKRLRHLRFAYGFPSADAWADFIGTGRTTWLNYEAGTRTISIQELINVCAKTGVTTDWVLRGMEHTLPGHVAARLAATPADQLPAKKRAS